MDILRLGQQGRERPVARPAGCDTLDRETELAVVIARRTRRLAHRTEAVDAIAGYTIANDLSDRHRQMEISGGQWSKGKIARDSSTSVGVAAARLRAAAGIHKRSAHHA
ncbi:fumarylacetoacetate hydrolase family protein [Actinomycetospora termitidis]|uniref:Fumarylacetoacetate hydrolase family protein n=1 Tax=Actinomycetospora termitidis TaxID=3053470 RepID=A0ABT7M694_9PSEU|nr:fumarylacetoacetate hydrolase family protein [Actinomycetospora sp. Odt1-22]MDL5156048.1 fumarylacetoacetate hydrolase family protein [Actinomycetospora sp. Odt1-22]